MDLPAVDRRRDAGGPCRASRRLVRRAGRWRGGARLWRGRVHDPAWRVRLDGVRAERHADALRAGHRAVGHRHGRAAQPAADRRAVRSGRRCLRIAHRRTRHALHRAEWIRCRRGGQSVGDQRRQGAFAERPRPERVRIRRRRRGVRGLRQARAWRHRDRGLWLRNQPRRERQPRNRSRRQGATRNADWHAVRFVQGAVCLAAVHLRERHRHRDDRVHTRASADRLRRKLVRGASRPRQYAGGQPVWRSMERIGQHSVGDQVSARHLRERVRSQRDGAKRAVG